MKVILLFFFLGFVFIEINAQEKNVILEVKDLETNDPIQYYTINDGEKWLVGDKNGRVVLTSYFINKALKLHCLSYPDTTIMINLAEDHRLIMLKSYNLLNEITIKPSYRLEKKIIKLNNNEKVFNSVGYVYTSKLYGRPIEYGQIYDFDRLVCLRFISFKAKANYPPEKIFALLHIYKISKPNSPIPLMVSKLNYIRPFVKNGYFKFDLINEKIYLDSGEYIFSLEVMPTKNPFEKVYVPFNLNSSNPSIQNTSNRKGERSWINASHNGQLSQLITTVEYQNVIK